MVSDVQGLFSLCRDCEANLEYKRLSKTPKKERKEGSVEGGKEEKEG